MEEQPVLAVTLQLLRGQPSLAVPFEGVLHSQHTMVQPGMKQPVLAVLLAYDEQPALAGPSGGVHHTLQGSLPMQPLFPTLQPSREQPVLAGTEQTHLGATLRLRLP